MSALIRWLPKLAVASADDIARFGPQAARVRTLLDFLPTMSNEAARVADEAKFMVATLRARDAALRAANDDARRAALSAAGSAANNSAMNVSGTATWDAADAEVVSDLISPENYRILTNPLATGRAIDVLTPRYKNTQFRELLQELAPKRLITQPSDVLGVGRIASLPDEVAIREAIDLVANYGMTFEEALNVIRMV